MATLVDSNVFLDMIHKDPDWGLVSKDALEEAINRGEVILNTMVLAEIAPSFTDLEELNHRLPADLYRRDPIPEEAAFLAGRVHAEYRKRGGRRTRTLPDFFIGAHCAVRGFSLLTRDPRRILRYFPTVTIVEP